MFFHIYKKSEKFFQTPPIKCPGQESNLHALRHTHLKRARLPIPPPGHQLSGAKVDIFCDNAKYIHFFCASDKLFFAMHTYSYENQLGINLFKTAHA